MASSKLSVVRAEPAPAGEEAAVRRRTFITIRGLSKSFNGTVIYDNFDLDLPQGEFISIFGPNGCGKSTLINMVSGLMPMDAGQVLFDGQTIQETRLSYVFQNYRDALFPWIRAIDNIHYPLKVMGLSRAERNKRVEQLLADFEVKIDLNAYPYMLSGGQQQTVSILRALVTNPEVLFLDEPFSALDYEMTLFMREQLQRIFMKTRTTTLLGLARPRRGGAARQPRAAADAAADPRRGFRRRRLAVAARHRERDQRAVRGIEEPLSRRVPPPDR